MGDWLRVYNAADVAPFIEAFKKMAEQYYTDKIDMCKDAVSISAVSMTYVLELPGAFVTYAEINKKSSNTVVVMVPWNVVIIVKNVSQISRPWKSVSVKRQPFMSC